MKPGAPRGLPRVATGKQPGKVDVTGEKSDCFLILSPSVVVAGSLPQQDVQFVSAELFSAERNFRFTRVLHTVHNENTAIKNHLSHSLAHNCNHYNRKDITKSTTTFL